MSARFPPHSRTGSPERGQTGIDFIVGVGIFLLTIAFVFSFVPGALAPFGDSADHSMVADRIGDDLVYENLGGTAGPSVLDDQCTLAFFGYASSAECPFDGAGAPEDWLAVPPRTHLNVTVEKNVDATPGREVLCWNAGRPTECTTGGDRLAYGDTTPTTSASVATASRVVSLGGTDAVLVVRVW